MRAVAATQYGGPDTYTITDVPDPSTGPDRIVVKVAAASINPVDYKGRSRSCGHSCQAGMLRARSSQLVQL